MAQLIGVGIAAGFLSAAHCAAMCGPLAATACGGATTHWSMLRYQSGRTVGYVLLGSIAGELGASLRWSGSTRVVLPLLAASLLCTMGIRLLHRNRPARLITLRVKRARPVLGAWRALIPREPALLGALSALLPCGALAGALLLAALGHSAAGGAAVMFGFVTASGMCVVASSWLLLRIAAVRRRALARLCMAALWSAAAFILVRPVYAELTHPGPPSGAGSFPTCH
jgi:sulfite exporter TauE/SafE